MANAAESSPEAKSKAYVTKTLDAAPESDGRTIRHYITMATVDEDGEVLLPRGADLSRFKKSPTVFDTHDYTSKSVVGTNVGLEMMDDGIIASTRFSVRPPSHPPEKEWHPDTLLWLYQQGDIKGWSVGFTPLEARNPTKADRERWGPEVKRVYTRWRMLEYSVAALPCNGEALTLSGKGILSARLAKVLDSGRLPTTKEWSRSTDASTDADIPVAPVKKVFVYINAAPEPVVRGRTPIDTVAVVKSQVRLAVSKACGGLYE